MHSCVPCRAFLDACWCDEIPKTSIETSRVFSLDAARVSEFQCHLVFLKKTLRHLCLGWCFERKLNGPSRFLQSNSAGSPVTAPISTPRAAAGSMYCATTQRDAESRLRPRFAAP